MSRFVIFTFFFFVSSFAHAQESLEFVNPNTHLSARIDLKSHEYWVEESLNRWVLKSTLKFEGLALHELPKPFRFKVFTYPSKLLFVIEGSGQIYALQLRKNLFERIDKTYFRGYNFGALIFSRRDTIFSFGGSGFWHINNVQTFFDPNLGEWERIKHDSNGPKGILSNFSGYLASNDQLYVLDRPDSYLDSSSNTWDIYKNPLGSKKWELLGRMDTQRLLNSNISLESIRWVSGYFIASKGSNPVLMDPFLNKMYLYKGPKSSFFNPGFQLFRQGDWLYSYQKNAFNKANENRLDSLLIKDVLMDSSEIDSMYQRVTMFNQTLLLQYLFIGLFAFSVLLNLLLLVRYYKKNSNNQKENLDWIIWQSFLFKLINYQKGTQFSAVEITEMMGYGHRSHESQRQLRSKLLLAINHHFKSFHSIDPLIIRSLEKNDNRYYVYQLSDEGFDCITTFKNK